MRNNALIIAGLLVAASLACNLPSQTGLPTTTVNGEPTGESTTGAALSTVDTSGQPTAEASATVSSSVAVPGGDDGAISAGETRPVHGEVIYETRFLSGWPPVTTDYGSSSLVDGAYRFEVGPDGAHWVFTSRATESAFYAELTASPVTCPAGDDSYGIVFQYESSSSFRFFAVTCDDDYVLGERAGTRNRAVASGSLPEGVSAAEGEHIIGVWVHDTTISGYVDGHLADSATFDTMPAGDIGPFAETGENGITVDFSRLVIYRSGE